MSVRKLRSPRHTGSGDGARGGRSCPSGGCGSWYKRAGTREAQSETGTAGCKNTAPPFSHCWKSRAPETSLGVWHSWHIATSSTRYFPRAMSLFWPVSAKLRAVAMRTRITHIHRTASKKRHVGGGITLTRGNGSAAIALPDRGAAATASDGGENMISRPGNLRPSWLP